MDKPFSFTCTKCGEVHVGMPDLGFDAPLAYHQLTPAERAASGALTSDTCVIAGEQFYIRGVLDIPVQGMDRSFGYGVWVSLSPANFARYKELFKSADPSAEPAYFGWLCNSLPGYPDTLSLKTNVHLQPVPRRPFIELQATDHPLSLEQREGITVERLRAILEANEHPGHTA